MLSPVCFDLARLYLRLVTGMACVGATTGFFETFGVLGTDSGTFFLVLPLPVLIVLVRFCTGGFAGERRFVTGVNTFPFLVSFFVGLTVRGFGFDFGAGGVLCFLAGRRVGAGVVFFLGKRRVAAGRCVTTGDVGAILGAFRFLGTTAVVVVGGAFLVALVGARAGAGTVVMMVGT